VITRALFWGSIGALGWTHVAYPLAVAGLARVRTRPILRADIEPPVTFVVAAHDEALVIERRLENLLALDYPPDKLEIVIVSDGSADRTDDVVEAFAAEDSRVRLLRVPRGGKTAAQDHAVRATSSEILAFSDANTHWRPDALRMLVRNFADPAVAYVCGKHFYEQAEGSNREWLYARFEGWLRRNESRIGSITGGVGPIYAVRRDDYLELDPRLGHDVVFPYLLAQRGRRSIVDPAAVAWEKPARNMEDEYGRKLRMFEHSWLILFRGSMLRRQRPLHLLALVSHRHLRYASGPLHLVLLATSARLVRGGPVYRGVLAAQVALLLAALRPGVARYYVVVTWATVPALLNYFRAGVSPVWEKAEGSR
jgi:cellulose synthase/poly-beta-1,6-N-acetylglucosamine synthase-like glycosyltransferase